MTDKAIRNALIFLLQKSELRDRAAILASAGDRQVGLGAELAMLSMEYDKVIKSLKEEP